MFLSPFLPAIENSAALHVLGTQYIFDNGRERAERT